MTYWQININKNINKNKLIIINNKLRIININFIIVFNNSKINSIFYKTCYYCYYINAIIIIIGLTRKIK